MSKAREFLDEVRSITTVAELKKELKKLGVGFTIETSTMPSPSSIHDVNTKVLVIDDKTYRLKRFKKTPGKGYKQQSVNLDRLLTQVKRTHT